MTRKCETRIYLWGTIAISFALARPCKNDAIWCHNSAEQPLFQMKVYVWVGDDRGWDTFNLFCLMQNVPRHMPSENVIRSELRTSVLSSHALVRVLRLQHHYIFRWRFSLADGGAWVNLRINSVRLPLVTGHFDFLENLRQNCGQSIQCNARWGKSICSQLHCNQHHQSIHLCPCGLWLPRRSGL